MSANPGKETVPITFRTEQQKREALEKIAQSMDRDLSCILNEALNCYLNLYSWQVQQIQKGIDAADAGDFLSDDEIHAAIARWTQ